MKRFLPMVLTLAVALSIPVPARALNEWTVIVYACADDEESAALEEAVLKDCVAMDSLGSGNGVEVIVQMDRGKKLSSYMKKIYSDPDYPGVSRFKIGKEKWHGEGKLGELNMGSPAVLYDCMKWAATSHPAKRYVLFLSGHGSGLFSWRGTGSVNAAVPGAVDFDPDRFVAYDDSDGDCLTVFEVRAVLDAFRTKLNRGRPLDMIAMDSCLSATVEVAYELRGCARVMVASPATIPIIGFDYRAVLSALKGDPAISAEALGERTVKAFIDEAPCQGKGDVMGAWRLGTAMEDVASATSGLAVELNRAMGETGRTWGVKDLVEYGNERYWDLKRICQSIVAGKANLHGASNEAEVLDRARAVLDARAAACISLWYGGGWSEKKVGGLSICWPSKEEFQKWEGFYGATAFARDGKWDEMLSLWTWGVN